VSAAVPFLFAFLLAAVASALIVSTTARHVRWTGDAPSSGPQKLHREPTPRIGGIAIAFGFLVSLLATKAAAPVGSESIHAPLAFIAALMVPFSAGLYEDVTQSFGAWLRLAATFIAAAIAYYWMGTQIVRFEMPLLDALLTAIPLGALFFTMFCVGGVAHAFNLTDGLNGLLGGITLIACGVLAITANAHADKHAFFASVALAGATLGFLLFNFPRARLFAGDSGAYLIGTAIALLAISLVARNTTVNPWLAFVAVLYPFTDTTFAIVRRLVQRKPIMEPDAEHLHSLLASKLAGFGVRGAHPLSTLMIVSCVGVFSTISLANADSTVGLVLCCAVFAAVYAIAWFVCEDTRARPEPQKISHTQLGAK
jgi:UDP-N-acetylmuramyl pentapeptide phosphotransferase/UDP-N-acetylglucosamine-1-phosphate transferase